MLLTRLFQPDVEHFHETSMYNVQYFLIYCFQMQYLPPTKRGTQCSIQTNTLVIRIDEGQCR